MLDLVIRGGRVVTNVGAQNLDVGVKDGKIVVLRASDAQDQLEAARVVEANGKLVVPGGIDPHVHTSSPMPNATDGSFSDGPDKVSVAAVHGGTTTMADFAHWVPGDSLDQSFERKNAEWRGISLVDYAFHGTFREREIPFDVLEQVPDAVADGHASFKVWMTNTTPYRRWQKTDMGHIWGLMEKTAESNAMLCVHAEDDDIVMFSYKRLEHEGRTALKHMSEAHNELSEILSFQRVITAAKYVGAPIYIMHVSADLGIQAIREARAAGQPVYGESLQQYAYFTDDQYSEEHGAIYHTYPSLKKSKDRDSMWDALVDGTLSTVATDEVCTDLESKIAGKSIVDATGGHAGVEVRMAVAYTEGVTKRGISLQRYVDITSRDAAKILGCYPQKGEIAVGSDADLVLLDTDSPRTITLADMHETDYTPWEGYEASAWPTMTVLRGKVLVEDGVLSTDAPDGQLLKRKVSVDVTQRVGA